MTPKHILDGYRFLDFTQYLAGPTTSRLAVEMGAEVIKVELMPAGDPVRLLPHRRNNRSGYYIQQNRGKKGVCVDIRNPKGLELIKGLIKECDVLLENFAPGAIGRLGLSYDVVKEINPEIIMCSISAFGQTGPLSTLPGFDYIAMAVSGVMDMIGDPEQPPYFPMLGIGDVSAGVHALAAINGALLYRHKTGKGQYIDISLLDSYFHAHEINVQAYSGSKGKIVPRRAGHHHYAAAPLGLFKCQDGFLFMVVMARQWAPLCKAMGREDLAEHPDYDTNLKRVERKDEIVRIIEDWLSNYKRDDALKLLEDMHIPVAPVLSVPEAMEHPHLIEREVVRTIEDRGYGELQIPGVPLRFSEFPEKLDLQAPYLGEHNREVFGNLLGLSDAELETFEQEEVIKAEMIPEGIESVASR
ncbi:MAG TPA: formyl-CoA transferase [Porticoccaceae bacterium]|nr:formyl-CoA transferase [Porticoccaceae bacterium]